MRQAAKAVHNALRADALVSQVVGLDADGQLKVYEGTVKPNVEPPFLVWNFIDAPEPLGVYGDLHAIEAPQIQITAWGRNAPEAWDLWELVQEVMEDAVMEVDLIPYSLMRVRRVGASPQLRDEDTSWIQLPATYEVVMSR